MNTCVNRKGAYLLLVICLIIFSNYITLIFLSIIGTKWIYQIYRIYGCLPLEIFSIVTFFYYIANMIYVNSNITLFRVNER